ncbi:hypothetical protein ENTCAN_05406 [Enterobacter cancerogenus ATCC 35316]|nr:hypothetical protein ENTCAN_05406 [Enterobacter cancerogenus ATCC 35316]
MQKSTLSPSGGQFAIRVKITCCDPLTSRFFSVNIFLHQS